MRLASAGTTLLLSLWMSLSAFAEVIPGRWEKVEELPKNTPLQVSLISGDRLDHTFGRAAPDYIVTFDAGGQSFELPKSEIERILALERSSDSGWGKTMWGLIFGGAAGLATGAATSSRWTNEGGDAAGWIALWGGVGAAAGGAIGFILDKNRQEPIEEWVTVYEARSE